MLVAIAARHINRAKLAEGFGVSCGLMCNEIAQTGAADVLDGGDGYSLIVHGKGGKQRIVPMPEAYVALPSVVLQETMRAISVV